MKTAAANIINHARLCDNNKYYKIRIVWKTFRNMRQSETQTGNIGTIAWQLRESAGGGASVQCREEVPKKQQPGKRQEPGPLSEQHSLPPAPDPRTLTVMTSLPACTLKTFNNSFSRTSCFHSRRLRPQTPQRSDDEGGKSTHSPLAKPNPHRTPTGPPPDPHRTPSSATSLAGEGEPSSATPPPHSSPASGADKQAVRSHPPPRPLPMSHFSNRVSVHR